jgi:hypothetical protein
MGYKWNELGINEITNLFLYGQFQTPVNKENDAIIRDETNVTVTMDAVSMMLDGTGRYAFASNSSLIEAFMGGNTISDSLLQQNMQQGVKTTYTKKKLASLLGLNYYGITVKQYMYGWTTSDYLKRSYIYNTQAFKIADDAVFVIEADGTRHIENFAIIPDTNVPDNFDFQGGDDFTNAGNILLKDWIDPSGIGRTINFHYDNMTNIQRYDYQNTNYYSDIAKNLASFPRSQRPRWECI